MKYRGILLREYTETPEGTTTNDLFPRFPLTFRNNSAGYATWSDLPFTLDPTTPAPLPTWASTWLGSFVCDMVVAGIADRTAAYGTASVAGKVIVAGKVHYDGTSLSSPQFMAFDQYASTGDFNISPDYASGAGLASWDYAKPGGFRYFDPDKATEITVI